MNARKQQKPTTDHVKSPGKCHATFSNQTQCLQYNISRNVLQWNFLVEVNKRFSKKRTYLTSSMVSGYESTRNINGQELLFLIVIIKVTW